jgi:hypothetical protein
MVDQAKESLTIREAEAFSGLSKWTLNHLMNDGRLRYKSIGAARLLSRETLIRLLWQISIRQRFQPKRRRS